MTSATGDKENPPSLLLKIKDCNSIGEATISLRTHALNIKYGPNGIGKSTIARALRLRTEGEGSLEELTPFKYRASSGGPQPTVTGAETIKKVLTFDDAYVSQFAFQRDEVLKNSFEIFINTPEYREGLEQIEGMFEDLKKTFDQETDFNEALESFQDLRDAFNVTKTGAVSKTSRGLKALSVGGKLANIPEPLQGYSSFLNSGDPAGWITWQSKGKAFLDLSENCPFCSAPNINKTVATQVSTEYESAAVRNMAALRAVIDRLGRYFEPGYLRQLQELTTSIAELGPEQNQFLVNLRGQVETLLQKLYALRTLSFYALRDEKDVAKVIASLRIDLSLLHALNSEATASVVQLIDEKLDAVAQQIDDIRGRIGMQNTRVKRLIQQNQASINDFLRSAGYKYSVKIEPDDGSYRMLLEHHDLPGHLDAATTHLSYGERNAFALVLFMHHALSERPDLVVLDDPVSSFDKTKKFAVLHQLFHGKNSLRSLTSLLLTHDIEPAIDAVLTGTSAKFAAAAPVVHFLSAKSGVVSEKLIARHDIKTFSQVCAENITTASDDVIKCIYLRRRFEVHDSLEDPYELLSSLLHLRSTPTRKVATEDHEELTEQEIAHATAAVKEHIPHFNYDRLLLELKDPAALKAKFRATDVGYEKVQLFRVMCELNPGVLNGDDVLRKFINETYHIENEYVMQLNPRDFDAVPEYVIDSCSRLMDSVETP